MSNDSIIHIIISLSNGNQKSTELLKQIIDNINDNNKYILNVKNSKGWSPLHLAVLGNDIEIVKTLIEGGVDINIMDNTSKTPLELAFDNNYSEIFDYLKEKVGQNHFDSILLN